MRTSRILAVAAVLMVFLTVAVASSLADRGWLGVGLLFVLVVICLRLAWLAFDKADDAGVWFELDVRRKFKAVCREKHLAKMDIKTGRLYFPAFGQLVGGGAHCSLVIRPLLGQSLADWERAAEAFAMAFGVMNVRFTPLGDRQLRMQVGQQPLAPREFVPVRYEPTTGYSWRERLAGVAVGFTENGGRPYLLPLIDSHILVAGITGSGKNSVTWSLVLGLEHAIRAGVVRLVGVDPKKVELSLGRAFFGDRYANDAVGMVELLERVQRDLEARGAELEGVARRFEPSERHPLVLIIIDELAYLSALLPDRKLRERADKALMVILSQGRALGFVVAACLQDPRKSTLEYRDLFPTRVAMKLPKGMVDLVLGTGAYEAGAVCDAIPPKEAGAGVAFVLNEGEGVPQCVRMTWCPDELIKETAARIGDGGGSAPLPIGA